MTKSRLKVQLPGRDNAEVTWEDLQQLEKEHGVDQVRKWMKGGKLIFPQEAEAPKSVEFVKHMEKLKRRQEQRDYSRMMESAMPKGYYMSSTETSISPEHTGVGASGFQMGVMGMNMVIGVGCAYVGADYLGRAYDVAPLHRAAISLTAMIVVMILEMILFIIRAHRFNEIDQRKRKVKETVFAPAIGLGLDFSVLNNVASGNKKTD